MLQGWGVVFLFHRNNSDSLAKDYKAVWPCWLQILPTKIQYSTHSDTFARVSVRKGMCVQTRVFNFNWSSSSNSCLTQPKEPLFPQSRHLQSLGNFPLRRCPLEAYQQHQQMAGSVSWQLQCDSGSCSSTTSPLPCHPTGCVTPAQLKWPCHAHSASASPCHFGPTKVGCCKVPAYFQHCRPLLACGLWKCWTKFLPNACTHSWDKAIRCPWPSLTQAEISWEHPILSPPFLQRCKQPLLETREHLYTHTSHAWSSPISPTINMRGLHCFHTALSVPLQHPVQAGTWVIWLKLCLRENEISSGAKNGYVINKVSHVS